MGPNTEVPSKLIDGFRRLFRHLSRRRRVQLTVVFGLMLVGALAELVTLGAVLPLLALIADPGKASSYPLLSAVMERFGWTGSSHLVFAITASFAVVALVAGGVRLLLAWVSYQFVYQVGHDLGLEAYRRTLYQPYSYHVTKNTSELVSATQKIDLITGSVLLPLMQACIGAIISVFIVSALVLIDARIAFVSAATFGGLYLAVSFVTRRALRRDSAIIAGAHTARVQIVQEGLGGIRDVLIDHTQSVYISKFSGVDSKFRHAQSVSTFSGAAPRYVIEAVGMVVIAGLALALSQQTGGFLAALPLLGALALGAQRLLPLLQLVFQGWAQISSSRDALFDVLSILEMPLPLLTASDKAYPVPFEREISFHNVSYRYSTDRPYVVSDIDLVIRKGERVGFIGKTGSGKSTLLDLLMGLLQPSRGEIRIDGHPLTSCRVAGWQSQIAHVPQTIYLCDSTVADNIALGAQHEIDMSLVIQAATKAELHSFVAALADGYQTMVGERGIRLSGGQRQRIGIARALYKGAKVLVFDEATSALDNETEKAVMESIESLGKNLTILLIAHRLSTVAMCDRVVQLQEGRISTNESSGSKGRERGDVQVAEHSEWQKREIIPGALPASCSGG